MTSIARSSVVWLQFRSYAVLTARRSFGLFFRFSDRWKLAASSNRMEKDAPAQLTPNHHFQIFSPPIELFHFLV
ncbi:hypothetical protein EUGRSUZ_G00522 [Eucalyptus grandis]|uniref:Uncharacterized protein n=2 Tax=Eucalyptus grandis TaxID=71139 RepID=A0A059BBB5_EUCGR|nr:hypothetical protein EUGRSUZ_G00522 [Eucalyptus grandis]